jgi:hypothetical protein
VLHPRDWRNIPECVRQCCEVLLSRMDIIESQFKNYKEGFEDRNQRVMGQIGLVKKQCNEQITLVRQSVNKNWKAYTEAAEVQEKTIKAKIKKHKQRVLEMAAEGEKHSRKLKELADRDSQIQSQVDDLLFKANRPAKMEIIKPTTKKPGSGNIAEDALMEKV